MKTDSLSGMVQKWTSGMIQTVKSYKIYEKYKIYETLLVYFCLKVTAKQKHLHCYRKCTFKINVNIYLFKKLQ